MKENLHPGYKEVQVRCACGDTFTAGSTKDEISVEICSKCHPFFTGQAKTMEKGGRIERFNKKFKRD